MTSIGAQWRPTENEYQWVNDKPQGRHFPVLVEFPDFSRFLRHFGDSIQIGLGVLVSQQESTCEYYVNTKSGWWPA